MKPFHLSFIAVIGFVLSALCCACDTPISEPAISASCSQIGAQCQLPGGPLGVCQQIACAPGSEPPCFKCISQH